MTDQPKCEHKHVVVEPISEAREQVTCKACKTTRARVSQAWLDAQKQVAVELDEDGMKVDDSKGSKSNSEAL